MVIERALEKARKAAEENSATQRTAESQTSRTVKVRRSYKQAREPRPVFPTLEVNSRSAEVHRVLMSDSILTENAHAAASYRMLRTRFLHRLQVNQWRVLAVTSPGAGEGKSLTSLNLALNIARDKTTEVFLLDLDMRNPSICNYLSVTPPHELIDYFKGTGKPADVFFSIGLNNLFIAGHTVASVQASELLTNGRIEELLSYIDDIAPQAIVLLDLPPLLVTDEALLIAPKVDATTLVVTEGRTRRDSLARAYQLLSEFVFAGVILNRSTESFGVESYYGYDHYAKRKT
jgi:protein-tyrosine kinase